MTSTYLDKNKTQNINSKIKHGKGHVIKVGTQVT